MNDTYDFETGIWSAKNKAETYYRLDYRGQDEPIKQIETKATIHINAHDIITCIEFENVPFEAHMPHFDSEDAEKHQRESAAMIERERIIKLLTDLDVIRRDFFGHLVAFNTDGTEVVYLTGLEGSNTKVSGGDFPNVIKGEK